MRCCNAGCRNYAGTSKYFILTKNVIKVSIQFIRAYCILYINTLISRLASMKIP